MKLKPLFLAVFSASLVTGCTSNLISEQSMCFDDNGDYVECRDLKTPNSGMPINAAQGLGKYTTAPYSDPSLFKTTLHFQLLGEYVEQIAMELKDNFMSERQEGPIVITSIVDLDNSLQNTSLLGNQISELFYTELQDIGFHVSDHKVTNFIKINRRGDTVMSRDIQELKKNLNIGYVLTGTLSQNKLGITANIRIVSLSTNRVAASATKLLPQAIVNNY
ncbi:MAG: flagellar biosynthesis protein FlgO [Gammaproteobacteria bacterium]|nr:flagellar biosynthesis protein FlgO [Gammaproteobacteria bacterium]